MGSDRTTQITLTGGFMLNVRESVADVANRLNDAARNQELLISFTSSSFLSSVSDQVFVNPAHVTQVIEVPGG